MSDMNDDFEDNDNIPDDDSDDSFDTLLRQEMDAQNNEAEPSVEEPPVVEEPNTAPDPVASNEPAIDLNKLPASLPPALKDKFAGVDPAIKEWALKIERNAAERERTNSDARAVAKEVNDIAAPYVPMINAMRTTPQALFKETLQGIYTLTQGNAQQQANFITDLIVNNKIDLDTLDGVLSARLGNGPTPAPKPTIDPVYAQKIDRFEQFVTQQEQGAKQQQQARIQTDIEKFAADPVNKHFHTVMPEMFELLDKGLAQDLPTAYEKAVRLSDKAQQAIQEEKKAAQQRKQAGTASSRRQGIS